MNETSLKKVVERAVRPVRASEARKLPMRLELLGHLTSLYEEERVRLGDDDAAFEAACARFGDPVELSQELDRTVGPLGRVAWAEDRILRTVERQLGYREDRSIAWHLGRMILVATLAPLGVTGLVAFAVFFVLSEEPSRSELLSLLPFPFFVASLTFLLHGTGIALASSFFDAERPRWGRAFLQAVACVVAMTILLYALWWAVIDDLNGLLADLPIAVVVVALLPIGLILAAWSSEQTERPLREWSRLQLDERPPLEPCA
jgi:cation transport ATPase